MGKTALFLTYNSVGQPGDYPQGKLERGDHAAIIFQHPRGERWGVYKGRELDWLSQGGPSEEDMDRVVTEREALAMSLYEEAFGLSDVLDLIVVYVGTGGSEGAIELAARQPLERLYFVLCSCNLQLKLEQIAVATGADVPILRCECGGQRTMARLVEQFLSTGLVGPATF